MVERGSTFEIITGSAPCEDDGSGSDSGDDITGNGSGGDGSGDQGSGDQGSGDQSAAPAQPDDGGSPS